VGEVHQIAGRAGRAGRYGPHEEGFVSVLAKAEPTALRILKVFDGIEQHLKGSQESTGHIPKLRESK
jgi:replicative superfamily II helicase